jgi:hypothetical protein
MIGQQGCEREANDGVLACRRSKVLHCDPAQDTIFREWLSRKYGVTVATHRGKEVQDYLDMIFDFSAKGKVMVTMMDR